MSHFDFQRQDSADELLAGWMNELESVLYSSEVEEAIKEVTTERAYTTAVRSPLTLCVKTLGMP